jgi:hypothetical protein
MLDVVPHLFVAAHLAFPTYEHHKKMIVPHMLSYQSQARLRLSW